jgi:hypothetical protein
MKHYQKYIELLENTKKIRGGDPLDPAFLANGKWMNNPNVWFLSNNSFYRNPLILKLIKFSPKVLLETIFNKKNDLYGQFINLLFIKLDDTDKSILQKYKDVYEKYLQPYESKTFTGQLANPADHLVFVTKVIEYFRETYTSISTILDVSSEQDKPTADKIKEHFTLFDKYWSEWERTLKAFYGESGGTKDTSGWLFLTDPDTRRKIEDEHLKLNESSVVTYLKVRADADDDGNVSYNEYFNMYVQPIPSSSKIPQAFFLTGPNPNRRIPFHKKGLTANIVKAATAKLKYDASSKSGSDRADLEVALNAIKDTELDLVLPKGFKVNPYESLKNLMRTIDTLDEGPEKEEKKKEKLKQLEFLAYRARHLIPNKDGNLLNIGKYDVGNIYGPLTRIFSHKMKNKEVADQCTEIVDKLKQNKSVVVIGYGASGAGKTSGLIYFKQGKTQDEKDGILINILKKLDGVDAIKVTVQEIFASEFGPDGKTPVVDQKEFKDIEFIRVKVAGKEDKFVLKDVAPTGRTGSIKSLIRKQLSDVEYAAKQKTTIDRWFANRASGLKPPGYKTNYNISSMTRDDPLLKKWGNLIPDVEFNIEDSAWAINKKNGKTVFTIEDIRNKCYYPKDDKDPSCKSIDPLNPVNILEGQSREISELGDFVITLVDTVRMVSPTPNNPVSSRSHVLITIDIGSCVIVFCDLAGVENAFTCDTDITQAQFLNLNYTDPKTGFEPSRTDGKKIPYYSSASNINFTAIHEDPLYSKYLNHLDYSKATNRVTQDGLNKLGDLRTKAKLVTHKSKFTPDQWEAPILQEDFPFLDIEKTGHEVKYAQILAILAANGKTDLEEFPSNDIPDLFEDEQNYHYSVRSKDNLEIRNPPKALEYKYLIQIAKIILPAPPTYNKTKKTVIIGPTEGGITALATKKNEYDALNETDSKNNNNYVRSALNMFRPNFIKTKEIIDSNQSKGTQNSIYNAVDPSNITEINSTDALKMIRDKYNKEFEKIGWKTPGTELPSNFTELLFDLLELLNTNDAIFSASNVKERCINRAAEGALINRALYGLKSRMTELIEKMSSSAEDSLIQRLPLIKEPCFKFFCNQNHAYCYSQLRKESNGVTSIIDTIEKNIGTDKMVDLTFVVFGVLNLSVNDKDDPPKVPYTFLNNIKVARDRYLTYIYFGNENMYRKEFIDIICKEYTGYKFTEWNDLAADKKEPLYDSIKHTLTFFDDVVGPLRIDVDDAFTSIKDNDPDILPKVMKLIKTIESINALSIPGTMDFINELKNVFLTDMNCSLYTDTNELDLKSGEHIENYINIITEKPLGEQIAAQRDYMKDPSKGMKSMNEFKIEPIGVGHGRPAEKGSLGVLGSPKATAAPTLTIKAPPTGAPGSGTPGSGTPGSVTPGSVTPGKPGLDTEIRDIIKGGSHHKQTLIQEYKQLKKLYKKLKHPSN